MTLTSAVFTKAVGMKVCLEWISKRTRGKASDTEYDPFFHFKGTGKNDVVGEEWEREDMT